jgi:hypothetical protein
MARVSPDRGFRRDFSGYGMFPVERRFHVSCADAARAVILSAICFKWFLVR